MTRLSIVLSAIAAAGCLMAPSAFAASPEEQALLGCGCEDAQFADYLPFKRAIGVSGVLKGTLTESAVAAGVPAATMVEAVKALATGADLDRDLHDGDRFYIRYEQTFTSAGAPIEVGRVLWLEIKTATKGTLALHRFRPAHGDSEALWFANGQGTAPAPLEMPLKSIAVTSNFGMRADPLDQPYGRTVAMGPIVGNGSLASHWKAPAVLQPSPLLTGVAAVNEPTPLGLSLGLLSSVKQKSRTYGGGGAMAMHEGVDLVAGMGTPVYAAGDGIVIGARPNGRYGNWIDIDHADKLATVYGHLSAFAPGIAPGVTVKQGDLIGFTGNTGRVTGPHLHFEIRVNGKPTNPIGNPALKHAQLSGPDLVRFKKVIAADQAEREREAKSM